MHFFIPIAEVPIFLQSPKWRHFFEINVPRFVFYFRVLMYLYRLYLPYVIYISSLSLHKIIASLFFFNLKLSKKWSHITWPCTVQYTVHTFQAVETTNGWLLTDGWDAGVSKAVGEAVRHSQQLLWQGDGITELKNKFQCIGIMNWNATYNRSNLLNESVIKDHK